MKTQQNKMLRLKSSEQEALRVKAIEINKKLIHLGMQPLKDNEIIHEILKLGISNIDVDQKGRIYLEIV